MLAADERLVIGSNGSCDVILPDASVAGRHLELTVSEHGVVEIKDLGNPHGTWVNDTQLFPLEPVELGVDDRVTFGDNVLELEPASVVPARVAEPWPETLSSTELALAAKLRAEPADEAARQIYADWLEAEGHHLRAAFVRRAPDDESTPDNSELFGIVKRHTELAWRAIVGRGPIAGCPFRMCPGRWHLMQPISGDDRRRRCDLCNHFVSYDDGVSRHRT